MKQRHTHSQGGFTLIELSIVAVIIALLAVAVTTGKGLLEHARIRSLSQEMLDLGEAFTFFQEQYDDLPGDMSDAWDYWGTTCAAVEIDCNGNGNERIADKFAFPINQETYMAWRHLQLAGMLGGNELTGQDGTPLPADGRRDDVVGVHIPASNTIASAGYWVQTIDTLPGNVPFFGTYITFAAPGVFYSPVLSPRQLSVIDHKLDDGRPRTGRIRDNASGNDSGIFCSDNATLEYYADIDDKNTCVLNFKIDNIL